MGSVNDAREHRRGVAILGSTGSIGTTALRVLERQNDRFRVAALTAHSNVELLREQVAHFAPSFAGVARNGATSDVVAEFAHKDVDRCWSSGAECLVEAVRRDDVDIVLNAVVGAAGLDATLAALARGKRVALANKETLVMAGSLVTEACAAGHGEIVPVDSEHSAILQCMTGRPGVDVRRVIITASGGPFREWSSERLAGATLDDALRHPTWRMGRKITVDSATLANKALEVIEAHFLFGLSYDRIEVVVHPQSIVHSFVEFVDGSVLAQLGVPSMELPVLYALTHPERVPDSGVPSFDPIAVSPLTFEPVRGEQFPAFALGVAAGRQGGAAPAVFNAANEAAVALFLDGRIRFADIGAAIAGALDALGHMPGDSRDSILAADAAARTHVQERFA
jgi:1-deoxy-D-xylulose-5-phosphate reductoisomerase